MTGMREADPSAGVRERNRDLRVSKILLASRKVFADCGYAGYSMRKVAQEAGVRLNTIQHHFGDLDALVLATLRSEMGAYTNRFRRIMENKQLPPRDKLDAILEDNVHAAGNADVQKPILQAYAAGSHNASIQRLIRELYQHYEDTLTQLVHELAPEKSAIEARISARLGISLIEGFALEFPYFEKFENPPVGTVIARMKATCLAIFGETTTRAASPARG